MIDPRFSDTGAAPFVSEFGMPPISVSRHRRHHKHRHGHKSGPALSRDESIHKVDQRQSRRLQQNGDVQFSSGYGVPYNAAGFAISDGTGFHQQQTLNRVEGFHPPGMKAKQHRHRHRHNRGVTVDLSDAVPEQLIGQRSSSVLGNEISNTRSPLVRVDGENHGEKVGHYRHHRHHHHHHHHGGEHKHSHSGHHSHGGHRSGSAGGEGYGHINDELIFIERGDHSPHRQEPPAGYEYKGKIEVQSIEKETHSHSHSGGSFLPPPPLPPPPPPTTGSCPPGWHQVVLTNGAGGSFGGSGGMFSGQSTGGTIGAGSGFGFGGGTGGGAGGFGNFGSQGQLIADYIVEPGSGIGGGSEISNIGGGSGFSDYHGNSGGHTSVHAKIIEVWQKRQKVTKHEKSRSRSRSHSHSRERSRSEKRETFDFERFRADILKAIERIVKENGSSNNEVQWKPHVDGKGGESGGQTSTTTGGIERHTHTNSEVRVIVQPIQPVFYMPRQTETTGSNNFGGVHPPQPQPHPIIPQPASVSEPKIIYVPRNVYVPVIKPVFVPRERVIVRPQVIQVARPVLVDRPVPVTQRPIIIEREKPIPVPVRGSAQVANNAGGSNIIREEYVYRDNLPVAYGGRCAEVAGGVNYGYMPTQEEHQYTSSSSYEAAANYGGQGSAIDVTVPDQFQQSQSFSQGSSSNGKGLIEVLDSTVNGSWQRTDQSALLNRYGQSALNIVQKTTEVEQQMYQELRQRASSGDIQRSASAGSYGSGFNAGIGPAGQSFS